MSLITRQAKGSKLTIQEMDGNLEYLEQLSEKAYINYFDFNSDSITNITTINTWVKLNSNTTEGFSNNGLIHTNNKVTNIGQKRIFQLEGIASVSSGNNNEIHFSFYKNNNIIPCSEQKITTSSAGRSNAIPIQCLAELDTNEYLEVWTKNASGTTDITLKNLNVIIKQL